MGFFGEKNPIFCGQWGIVDEIFSFFFDFLGKTSVFWEKNI
jgi:hypothetical protein